MISRDASLWKTSCAIVFSYQLPLSFRVEAFNRLIEKIELHRDNIRKLIAVSMNPQESRDIGTSSGYSSSSEGLRDHLARLTVKSSYDQKEFFPHGCIDSAITREAVCQELGTGSRRLSVDVKQTTQQDLDSLVDFIMLRSKTVFAILICCGLDSQQIQEAMPLFRSLGLDDSNLPIVPEDSSSPPLIFYSSTEKAYRKPWNESLVTTFCSDVQWMFLAPVFLDRNIKLMLHESAILPFTGAIIHRGAGLLGDMHEATIHSAHRKHIGIHVRIFESGAQCLDDFSLIS